MTTVIDCLPLEVLFGYLLMVSDPDSGQYQGGWSGKKTLGKVKMLTKRGSIVDDGKDWR